MSREQDCIRELYLLVDEITKKACKGDLSLLRINNVGGCDCYMGAPPICKIMDNIIDKYGDVIRAAHRAKEVEEWNRRTGDE